MGNYCTRPGSYKWANCGNQHSVQAVKCLYHRHTVAIAKSDRSEWKERGKKQEEIIFQSQDNDDRGNEDSDLGEDIIENINLGTDDTEN